jgi:uncharacterized protein
MVFNRYSTKTNCFSYVSFALRGFGFFCFYPPYLRQKALIYSRKFAANPCCFPCLRASVVGVGLSLIIIFQKQETLRRPMGIGDQIQKDIVAAMRAREELRLSTLRMVKSALKNKEIDKRAPLDEKEEQQILSTLIKQRKDSIEQFVKGGRQELADKEAAEIKIIEAYLPKAMGEEEIAAAVKATIAEMGSPTMKDMGTVMKNAMVKLQATGARVEGKTVSEIVKKQLGG